MPRKGEVKKREGLPDPKYGDKQVAKFINTLMSAGKKSVALRMELHAPDRTLTGADADACVARVVAALTRATAGALRS